LLVSVGVWIPTNRESVISRHLIPFTGTYLVAKQAILNCVHVQRDVERRRKNHIEHTAEPDTTLRASDQDLLKIVSRIT
jgi:hypothetical protein